MENSDFPPASLVLNSLKLKNGREVFVRPILPTDNGLIADLFRRISPESRYKRFLRDMDNLPEDMLNHFTHIDYETDFSLVALIEDVNREEIIAVVRYMHDPVEKDTDLGLAVRDDWQNMGLGKTLLKILAGIAKGHGITRFTSMMDTRNTRMEKVLRDLGYEVRYSLKSGYYHVEIFI